MLTAAAIAQKEFVELAGQLYDFDEIVIDMDPALYYEACQWAGYSATYQAILDTYLRLHQSRLGEPFVPRQP